MEKEPSDPNPTQETPDDFPKDTPDNAQNDVPGDVPADDFDDMAMDDDPESFDDESFGDEESADVFDDEVYEEEWDEDGEFEEEWDEELDEGEYEDEEFDTGAVDPDKEKKNKLFNLLVLGGAGVIGLGFFYTQISGDPGPTLNQPVPVAQEQTEYASNGGQDSENENLVSKQEYSARDNRKPIQEKEPERVNNGEGLLHNPDVFADKKPEDDGSDYVPRRPDEGKKANLSQNNPERAKNSGTEDNSLTPLPDQKTAISDGQVEALINQRVDQALSAQNKKIDQVQDMVEEKFGTTQKSVAGLDEKLNNVLSQLNTMSEDLQNAKDMAKNMAMSAVTSGSSNDGSGGAQASVSSEELESLEKAIIYLDEQIKTIKETQSSEIEDLRAEQKSQFTKIESALERIGKNTMAPRQASSGNTGLSLPQPDEQKPLMTPVKDIEIPQPKIREEMVKTAKDPEPTPVVEKQAYKPVSRPAPQPPRWVLKGAKPGQAYVSRKGQRDITTVAVGDTLPGVGRITQISLQDNRWVVKGTQGQIRQ